MHRNRRFSPELLRDARQAAGLLQAELARLTAVSTASVKAGSLGGGHQTWHQRRGPTRSGSAYRPEVADDAEDLRRLRQSLGLTRAEAAARLGIEPFTLQRVEEGLELPPDPA